MKDEDAVEQMCNAFAQNFPGLAPGVTFQMPNASFTEPDASPSTYWARVTFVHNKSVLETIGARGTKRKRCSGTLYAQIFGPLDTGSKQSGVYLSAIQSIYEYATLGSAGDPIYMESWSPLESGNEGRWYMSTGIVAFRYYQQV